MTQSAGVDRDQLAVLRRLRQQLGQVEVLEVRASPPLEAEAGEQGELLEVQA